MSAVPRPAGDALRNELAAARQSLREAYFLRPNPGLLLRRHTQIIDRTVKAVWAQSGLPGSAALIATGGYGRQELYPSSDIDLLVLLREDPGASERECLERLIGTFWDIGL